MRRVAILFACSLVLWAIVTQLNHSISELRIYLFAGALFVTFAALMQPFASGLVAAMLTGLMLDANTPVPFGIHLVLFATAHIMIYRLRDRVPRNDTISRVTVAVLGNLGMFLLFSFFELTRSPGVHGVWERLIVDLVCSQLFLALVAPWFFALQARSLALAGCERENFA